MIASNTTGHSSPQGQLRFLTCGSVDDGKSTLIGRLLYDSGQVADDQLVALKNDSRRFGTVGGDLDLALLVDGLEAERQQGITIDVAYRYFATERRSFILADTPGHEQYTRNMATGASTASLAIILVDAQKGILRQTRRHSYICSLFGIQHIILAINKMDLVDYSQRTFEQLVAEYHALAREFSFRSIVSIPVAARHGDNVVNPSTRLAWYSGPTVLQHLEEVDIRTEMEAKPFRLPVQWVNRPSSEFRGFSGNIAAGSVKLGDRVVVAHSGLSSRVTRIVHADGDLKVADAGDAITLCLEDELDISRGDLLSADTSRPFTADQFAAHVLWMGEQSLIVGRAYLMRLGSKWGQATVTRLKYRVDISTFEESPTRTLAVNEIGMVNISTPEAVAFDAYQDIKETGAFILVDRYTHDTVACGLIDYALRRASNIHREHFPVDKQKRALLLGQQPTVLWFTGLSGSGKSTIAKLVEQELHALGRHTYALDGDNVRHGLNRDLSFTETDRVENIRRVAEVAKLFLDAGTIVLCSFISPFAVDREVARSICEPGEFIEVYVDTPLEECVRRDPKGLYAKAMSGAITNFTGINSPYEEPSSPEIHLRTQDEDAAQLAASIVTYLREHGRI